MIRIGIDATNVGGGGGITHLKEIISHYDKNKFEDKIESITIFASKKVLDSVPELSNLNKITFPELNKGLLSRVIFQLTKYDKYIYKTCDVLLSITGDYVGKFKPVVGMSRNMLLYERDIWKEIKQPKEVIRFWLNFQKQKKSFANSKGIIFISQYAQNYVSKQLNLTGKDISIIHHGVSNRFAGEVKKHKNISEYSLENPYKLLYVSPVHVYKHQWNVIEAVGLLRKKGFPIELQLIGNIIFKPSGDKLKKAIQEVDSKQEFIKYFGYVDYNEIDMFYKQADGLIFASTCENMPNTLIECMSSGVAIACSDKQPMPEFLKENGYYFNSYDVNSICEAIKKMITHPKENDILALKNLEEAKKYNWSETSRKTFEFLVNTYSQS
ncbi:MAG: glycosyltransferase family 1 protein [Limnohabitans sp.]|nr:glycosyltransferase family 1 protein [Limnohabitans sp.]